jgi:hypothetical protein
MLSSVDVPNCVVVRRSSVRLLLSSATSCSLSLGSSSDRDVGMSTKRGLPFYFHSSEKRTTWARPTLDIAAQDTPASDV